MQLQTRIRLCEFERYDIMRDQQVLRLEAITGNGTWWADVDAEKGVATSKKVFRDRVLEAVALGQVPTEIRIGNA